MLTILFWIFYILAILLLFILGIVFGGWVWFILLDVILLGLSVFLIFIRPLTKIFRRKRKNKKEVKKEK